MINGAGSLGTAVRSDLPVIEPSDAAELARALAAARAAGQVVLPRGGGTKMGWGNPPENADVILSTRRLDKVLEHVPGDMTATVEAGCTIARLQEALGRHGQRLAVDPLWPDRATVGGVLATNDNGSLRTGFGSLRDLVIGITAALTDGTLARSGGKVVKNVAGYDLPKLMVGAFGTLGVVTQATFRLHPLPRSVESVSFAPREFRAAQKFMQAVRDTTLPVTGLQMDGGPLAPLHTVSVRLEGSPVGVAAQADDLMDLATRHSVPATGETPTWREREQLFDDAGLSAICKVSVAPSQVGDTFGRMRKIADFDGFGWRMCVDESGVGLLRLSAPAGLESLAKTIGTVRQDVVIGTLTILQWPGGVERQVDAWGNVGDALPVMKRLKKEFDPSRTLNRGRFVGGI